MILHPNVADMLHTMKFSTEEIAAAVRAFDSVEGKRLEMGEMWQLLQVMAMIACNRQPTAIY